MEMTQSRLEEQVHQLTDGPGGTWLAVGEGCELCGSLDGGWVCAGAKQHLADCCDLNFVQDGKMVHCLNPEKRRHCVHGSQSGTAKKKGELQMVIALVLCVLCCVSLALCSDRSFFYNPRLDFVGEAPGTFY